MGGSRMQDRKLQLFSLAESCKEEWINQEFEDMPYHFIQGQFTPKFSETGARMQLFTRSFFGLLCLSALRTSTRECRPTFT
jgi:hypothetical protein